MELPIPGSHLYDTVARDEVQRRRFTTGYGILVVAPVTLAVLGSGEPAAHQSGGLRGLFKLAYRERITFRGEQRQPTRSQIDVTAVARRAEGELMAAQIGTVRDGGRVPTRLMLVRTSADSVEGLSASRRSAGRGSAAVMVWPPASISMVR